MKTFDECKDLLIQSRDEISKAYKPAEALAQPWHEKHRQATEALQRRYIYTRSDGSIALVTLRIDYFAPDPTDSSIPPGWRPAVGLEVPSKPYNDMLYCGRRADSTDYREMLRVQQWAEDWMAGRIVELPPSTDKDREPPVGDRPDELTAARARLIEVDKK